MSNYHHQSSKKYTSIQARCQQYIDRLACLLVILGLVLGGCPLWLLPVFAAPTPGNTSIDNQATGTFADLDDPAGTQNVVSNIVSVTVAEVVGINIIAANTPTPSTGAISNFDFKITNVGNDPTKFFLPSLPSAVSGGTVSDGSLTVIAYINAAGTQVNLTTPITIPAGGKNTGALSDPTLGNNTTLGSIPAGAAIVVRVPVTVTAAAGSPVSVTLGNTTGQPATSNTPYVAQTNDVYTVDNADSSVVGEVPGVPINGDATLHQQEASATQSANASYSISGNVFNDIDTSKIKAASGEDYTAADITAVLLNASNQVVSTDAIDAAGNYTIPSVVAGSYRVKIIKTPSTPLTAGLVIPPADDILPGTVVATGENLNGVIDSIVDRTQSITVSSSNLTNVNFGVQTPYVAPGPSCATAAGSEMIAYTGQFAPLASSGGYLEFINNTTASSVGQTGLVGWSRGVGNNGTAQVVIDLKWIDGTPNPSLSSTLELLVGGVVYGKITTVNGINSSAPAPVTYTNGASGNLTQILPNPIVTWKIDLPPGIANTQDVSIRFVPAATGGSGSADDFYVTRISALSCASSLSVSGNVFHDQDANVVINGTDAGTNAGSSTLTIYAVDTAGKVVDKTLVAANGTYTLANVPQNSSVKLRLSNDNTVAVGATAPTTPSLPSGWYHTGENLNGTIDSGTLGDIDLTTTTANLSNYNFGIRQPPVAVCPTLITGEFAGTFGTISSATKYRDLQNPVAGYTYSAPINTTEGQYVVTSAAYGSTAWNAYGAQPVTGHTTGAIDDAFLLINGSTSVGTFYQQTINVSPNRNLDVSVWVKNWTAAGSGFAPPSISMKVYAADGTTLLGSATVNNVAIAAGWVEALANINTGTNSKIVVKLQNTSTAASGNDFAIDDISVRYSSTPCLIASGSISGTVFSDADANVAINGTDAGTNASSSTLTVYAVDTSGKVVDKATVDAITGNYTLSNVPQNSSVKLRLSNDDTVAIGATAPTTPSLPTGWFHTGENLNGTIDPVIATLGDIALTTTTTNLTNENFGIRQATTIAADPAPATCTANFTTALNTGVSASGGQLAVGADDLNWTAEWIAGPAGTHPSPFGTPYAPPRPVGPMPAVVLGNLNPGIWVTEPSNARWISYPFRLSTNGNGVHSNADLDANIGEDGSANPIVGTSDAVRLKFTATVTLPSNANSIAVSLPVGVAMDNQFGSLKVNGVENLSPVPAPNPQANNFSSLKTVNITQGWQPGVNTIEIVMDSGQPQAGFFLGVQATSTQVCKTKANVLMVKRVTAINGNSIKNPNDNTPLNLFIDDTSAATTAVDDNHCNWPGATGSTGACSNTYTLGALAPGKVKPGDEIEYTIYYLNAGQSKAKQVRICDQLDKNLTFNTAFDNDPAHVGKGITLVPGIPGVPQSTDIQYLTNAGGDDKGELATAPVSGCNLSGNTGTNLSSDVVVVDVADPANTANPLMGSTGAGMPTTSYGYIRIKTTVK